MKIQTNADGIVEVPRVIKYFICNKRKIAIHRYFMCREFTNDYFAASDYYTGMQINYDSSIKAVIKRTINILEKNPNYDYSKYEIINK